jgi:hypothetical protein
LGSGVIQQFSEEDHVSHLQRLSYILGTLLIGVSTYLVLNDRRAANNARRRNQRPVTELAHDLQQAWSAYHNR